MSPVTGPAVEQVYASLKRLAPLLAAPPSLVHALQTLLTSNAAPSQHVLQETAAGALIARAPLLATSALDLRR